MNFVIYTRYIKENFIISPFTLLFSLATFPLSRHSPPRHSSLVIRHFFPFPVSTFPFKGSQRLLGMCTARAESVIRGWFVSFSSLSPFGGSGAYRINNSPHSPSERKSTRDFHHIPFVIRLSSFVISFNFPSLHSPFGGG